jgi:hypothetical protein
MAEAVGMSREETAAQVVSIVLLAGSIALALLQVPEVAARTIEFSAWIYVPGLLAMFLGIWQRQDHVVWMAIAWLSIFFMVDVYYGVSFFA